MDRFVFSMDSHVVEPRALWQEGLPAPLRDRALRAERREGYLVMTADGKDLHRMQIGDGNSDNPRIGGTNPQLRFQDMQKDGIDAELLFPNLGMMCYAIEDDALSFACMQVYNDWLIGQFGAYPETFVPTAVLPMREVGQTVDEFKRVVALGYRSVMLPTLPPLGLRYNNKEFDPIWAYAQERKVPIAFHVASGLTPITERGPGAAIVNYMRLGFATEELVTYMVAGGALDRHPGLTMVVIEAGASWMVALGERLDEVNEAHQFYVRPKLSRKPSQILYSQVKATFQFDRACLRTIPMTGHECLLWASDYPHMEGTFPRSRQVIDEVFGGTALAPEVRADILGGTAARLYGVRPCQLAEKLAA
ncbi:MAG TPA: amidohydrolase family protein [Burkholderiaceae bacterium]|jgi:predicted TIM-barrel fold metal-dependent hydrolase|nr:amidohydrolase family protein [Burkholderiaceae bacterium]